MTISEWIEVMQEPYKTQAKNNFAFEDGEDYQYISTAVLHAFNWNVTPEGFGYWNSYYETLVNLGL